jgi:hypothetical protein
MYGSKRYKRSKSKKRKAEEYDYDSEEEQEMEAEDAFDESEISRVNIHYA